MNFLFRFNVFQKIVSCNQLVILVLFPGIICKNKLRLAATRHEAMALDLSLFLTRGPARLGPTSHWTARQMEGTLLFSQYLKTDSDIQSHVGSSLINNLDPTRKGTAVKRLRRRSSLSLESRADIHRRCWAALTAFQVLVGRTRTRKGYGRDSIAGQEGALATPHQCHRRASKRIRLGTRDLALALGFNLADSDAAHTTMESCRLRHPAPGPIS